MTQSLHTQNAPSEIVLAAAFRVRAARIERLQKLAMRSPRKAKKAIRQLLRDRDFILATGAEVHAKRGMKVGSKTGPSIDELILLASSLRLDCPTSEPVHLRTVLRRNGRERGVYRLGIREAVRQRALLQICRATTPAHPRQFGVCEGRKKLDGWLSHALPNAALVLTTDIPDCFNRIHRDAVECGLPLSRRATKAALFDPMDRAKPLVMKPTSSLGKTDAINCSTEQHTVAMSSPLRGIPQGAALAQHAADTMIKKVLEAVEASADGVHAGAWGDNLIVVIEDASAVSPVTHALTSTVQSLFGGDVIGELIQRMEHKPAKGPFQFAGSFYQIKGGKLRKRTPEDRIDNYTLRLDLKLADALHTGDYGPCWRSLRGWLAQHKDCPEARAAALMLSADIAALEKGASSLTVHPTADP